MYALTYNPVHCVDCNLEISIHRLRLSRALVSSIAHWGQVYGGVYWLWLDSGEYEAWASKQLDDVSSPVNRKGLGLAHAATNTFLRPR